MNSYPDQPVNHKDSVKSGILSAFDLSSIDGFSFPEKMRAFGDANRATKVYLTKIGIAIKAELNPSEPLNKVALWHALLDYDINPMDYLLVSGPEDNVGVLDLQPSNVSLGQIKEWENVFLRALDLSDRHPLKLGQGEPTTPTSQLFLIVRNRNIQGVMMWSDLLMSTYRDWVIDMSSQNSANADIISQETINLIKAIVFSYTDKDGDTSKKSIHFCIDILAKVQPLSEIIEKPILHELFSGYRLLGFKEINSLWDTNFANNIAMTSNGKIIEFFLKTIPSQHDMIADIITSNRLSKESNTLILRNIIHGFLSFFWKEEKPEAIKVKIDALNNELMNHGYDDIRQTAALDSLVISIENGEFFESIGYLRTGANDFGQEIGLKTSDQELNLKRSAQLAIKLDLRQVITEAVDTFMAHSKTHTILSIAHKEFVKEIIDCEYLDNSKLFETLPFAKKALDIGVSGELVARHSHNKQVKALALAQDLGL